MALTAERWVILMHRARFKGAGAVATGWCGEGGVVPRGGWCGAAGRVGWCRGT